MTFQKKMKKDEQNNRGGNKLSMCWEKKKKEGEKLLSFVKWMLWSDWN